VKPKNVIVIGGSIAGLGAAVAFAEKGHRVTVLEGDATPMPPSHIDAFREWDRRGSPQSRQSHAVLARIHNLVRDHAPGLLEKLRECGATEMGFMDRAKQLFPDFEPVPGDEDIVFVASRRITFEWVARRYVIDSHTVDFRDGVEVTRLEAKQNGAGVPVVTGVHTKTADGREELLSADLVVDCTGRRSPMPRRLREIGCAEIREDSTPCGIYYTSRFYQLREGAPMPQFDNSLAGADLGYLKIGIFPGDSGAFSITLAASPEDDQIRKILKQPYHDIAIQSVPITAEWTSPESASASARNTAAPSTTRSHVALATTVSSGRSAAGHQTVLHTASVPSPATGMTS